MRDFSSPFVAPTTCVFAGCWLYFQVPFLPVGLLILLLGLGLALGRPFALCLAMFALGGLLPVARGVGAPTVPELQADAPAEVQGTLSGHWRQGRDSQSNWLRGEVTRQRGRVFPGSFDLWVSAPLELPLPESGAKVRLRGVLTRSKGYWNRTTTPPGPWRLWLKSSQLVQVEQEPGWLDQVSGRLRGRVEEAFAGVGLRSDGTAMARALVLGDSSQLPDRWKRGLRRVGLFHVLSVSGLHLALVGGFVTWMLFPLPRAPRLLLAAAAMALYLLVVGPLPALLRSALMAWLCLLAWWLKRPPVIANTWGVALTALLIGDPRLANDLGFQLTISATAGLIFLAPRLAEGWTRLPRLARTALSGTVAAQLATLPWTLPRFHLLTPSAPVANLLGVPWCGLVLVVDFAWVGLALVAPQLAGRMLWLLDGVVAPIEWCSSLPHWAAWPLPILGPPWLGLVLAAALAALLLRPRGAWLAGAVLVLVGLTWRPNSRVESEVVLLDVGQGDAILVRDGRQATLVDGGGWSEGDFGGRVLLPALLKEGVRRLDRMVMTHGDVDHCRGLVDLLDLIAVREVWLAPKAESDSCAAELVAAAGTRRRVAQEGSVLQVGRLRASVLHPGAESLHRGNEASVVLRIEGAQATVLLTGDIEAEAEAGLVRRYGERLGADLLKVGHHGSRTSSSSAFLAAVSPRWAVISAGRGNRYQHPSAEVVRRLERSGRLVLRTDRDGAVRLQLGSRRRVALSVTGPPYGE